MSNAVVASELMVKMAVDYASMKADMDKVAETVGATGEQINKAMSVAKTALVGLIGVASVGAFKNMILDQIEATAKFNDMADAAGVSASKLQALAGIAKYSGVSAESMAGAMNKLNRSLINSGEDGKGASAALRAIGLNYEDFVKLSPDKRMEAIAAAMAKYKDGSEKSAVAMAFFGRSGAQMVPVLKDMAAAGELQAKATDEQIAMADHFSDNLLRLQVSGDAWKRTLALGMLPALDDAAQSFLDVINQSGGLRDEVKKLVADGSVERWTRMAVEGFTYVMDAGAGLIRVVKSIGMMIGNVAAQIVTFWSGAGEALSKVADGDFKGALASMNAATQATVDIAKDANEQMSALWSEPTIGQKIRERMEQHAKLREEHKRLGDQVDADRPRIDTSALNESNAEATKKQKDELEKLVKAGNDFVMQAGFKITSMQQENDLGRQLTDGEKLLAKATEEVTAKKIVLNQAQWDDIRAKAAQMDALAAEREAQKQLAAAMEEMFKARQKVGEEAAKQAKQTEDLVERQLRENEAVGKTKQQLDEMDMARLREQRRLLEQKVAEEELTGACTAETEAHKDTLAALNKLIDAKEQGIHLRAAQEANEAWQRTAEAIGNGISDALYNAFQSGKDWFKSFWSSMVNAFKSTVFRMAIQAVVGGALGLGAGGASAGPAGGAGSMVNMLGTAKNLWSMVSGGFSGIGNSIAFGAQDLGSWLMTNTTGPLNSLGGSMMSNAGLLGQIGGYGAGIGAGLTLGRAISGRYSVGGSSMTTTAIGTAIGAVIAGPLGAAIGGAIGGLVNRAFGRAPKENRDRGIEGTLTGGTATGRMYQDWFQKGGWFRSNRSGTNYTPFDETTSAALDLGAKNVLDQTRAWAEALKLPGDALEKATFAFKIKLTDDEQANKDAISKLFSDYQETLVNQFKDVLAPFQNAGESIVDTMQRLVVLSQVSESLNDLGGIFSKVATSSIEARENIIALAGGIEQLMAKAGAFVKDYYTTDEQAGMQAKSVMALFSSLGISGSAVGGRDDFRRLVESIDVSTEQGQKQLVALLDIAPQFASLADYMKEQGRTLEQVAQQAPAVAILDQMLPQQRAQGDLMTNISQQIKDSNVTLERIVDAIKSGNVSIATGLEAMARILGEIAISQQQATRIAAATDVKLGDLTSNSTLAESRPTYSYDMGFAGGGN